MLIESKILNRARGGEKIGDEDQTLAISKRVEKQKKAICPAAPNFSTFFCTRAWDRDPALRERPTTKWHFYYKRQIFHGRKIRVLKELENVAEEGLNRTPRG